ncbi:MAG: aromatic ring-hydroxylating dioxygenase subunit alpha [Pleurocapsa sp. MO_226.B13]|nr:aromatic ring-hydroxylating dioxygenase subunit alpha [Pleurocapsa sp. MO_226.B13]
MLIPKRARVDTYPVQEKYGLVWLFLGDLPEKERPPLPPLPEFDDSTFRCISGEFTWNAHYTRVLDNLIDISHLPFIHPNSQGRGRVEEPQIEEYDVHLEEWSASATVTGKKPKKTRAFWKSILKKQGSRTLSVTVSFYMPNITRLKFDFSIGSFKLIIFSVHLPIDDNTTVSKWLFLRNFTTAPWADRDARKRTLKIMLEDKPVVESQSPKVLPYDLASELHVPADSLSIAYRKLRQKCLDMGWGIDTKIVSSDYGNNYVYN